MRRAPGPRPVRPNVRLPLRTPPRAIVDAVADVAAQVYAHKNFSKKGTAKAVQTLVGRGVPRSVATGRVVKRAKGVTSEFDLAASFTARSGFLGRNLRARPNPLSTHPTDDILIERSGRVAAAAQVKTGTTDYVLDALGSGKYDGTTMIANSEAVEELEKAGVLGPGVLNDRLSFEGVESIAISAYESRERTSSALTGVLARVHWRRQIDPLVVAMKAGSRDGLETLTVNLVADLLEASATNTPFDVKASLNRSLKAGAKVALRSTAVTWSQVSTFLQHAKTGFSARLIHRITSSTLAMSAIADVVVDTAFDLVQVFQNRMEWDEFMRRLGVTSVAAVGGYGGARLGLALTRNAPWWVQLAAMLIGGYLGTEGGRRLGERLFDGTGVRGWQLT